MKSIRRMLKQFTRLWKNCWLEITNTQYLSTKCSLPNTVARQYFLSKIYAFFRNWFWCIYVIGLSRSETNFENYLIWVKPIQTWYQNLTAAVNHFTKIWCFLDPVLWNFEKKMMRRTIWITMKNTRSIIDEEIWNYTITLSVI